MTYGNKYHIGLIDLDRPQFPRPVFRWRRVPRWLSWLCFLAAGPLWAFGSSVRIRIGTQLLGTEYHAWLFRLFEQPGGRWLIKFG